MSYWNNLITKKGFAEVTKAVRKPVKCFFSKFYSDIRYNSFIRKNWRNFRKIKLSQTIMQNFVIYDWDICWIDFLRKWLLMFRVLVKFWQNASSYFRRNFFIFIFPIEKQGFTMRAHYDAFFPKLFKKFDINIKSVEVFNFRQLFIQNF